LASDAPDDGVFWGSPVFGGRARSAAPVGPVALSPTASSVGATGVALWSTWGDLSRDGPGLTAACSGCDGSVVGPIHLPAKYAATGRPTASVTATTTFATRGMGPMVPRPAAMMRAGRPGSARTV
jgi:hypothetical protein